jgi:hypothetical protein
MYGISHKFDDYHASELLILNSPSVTPVFSRDLSLALLLMIS